MELGQDYWKERYEQDNTPWDIGHVSPPLMAFIDGLTDLGMKILIPGAGKSHEAIYLHEKGFREVYICDWVEEAFEQFLIQTPSFPTSHIICGDFFELQGKFDLILEQTFFCAINPAFRSDYVTKTADLLVEDGILAGLLFASHFEKEGPPFGGTKNEYIALFSDKFHILTIKMSKNSILPRMKNELFFKFLKK